MNSVQMHLALTHVPVILSLISLLMLVIAFFIKNTTLTRTSYIVMFVAGIAALPVFFTGESTEEAVENLPGVSAAFIERHEEVAKLAMVSIAATGLVALAALLSFRWHGITRVIKVVVLLLAIASASLMAQTAHLGGQIRHTEIRNNVAMENNAGNDLNKNMGNHPEKDDD